MFFTHIILEINRVVETRELFAVSVTLYSNCMLYETRTLVASVCCENWIASSVDDVYCMKKNLENNYADFLDEVQI